MDILKIIILSSSSLFVLFILAKIMVNKEISQLSTFDYIIGITIGSIAAEMSTALESDFMQPLVAMIVYALITVLISFINSKSLKIRRVITGTSLVLYNNGNLFKNNFKKSKLDLTEFLMLCRTAGYFNLSELQTVLIEPNGKLSFLPKSNSKPATPKDLNLDLPDEKVLADVILDGKLLRENLFQTGNDEIWLQKELASQGYNDINNIFLATIDSNNNLSVYKKMFKNTKDVFE